MDTPDGVAYNNHDFAVLRVHREPFYVINRGLAIICEPVEGALRFTFPATVSIPDGAGGEHVEDVDCVEAALIRVEGSATEWPGFVFRTDPTGERAELLQRLLRLGVLVQVSGPAVSTASDANAIPVRTPGRVTTAARWGTVLFAVALVAIIVAADRGALPNVIQRFYAFPGGDKVGHAVLFGALAFGATLTLPRWTLTLGRMQLPAASLVIAALVALEEASQARFPDRTLSLADLTASYVGIAAGTAAALVLLRRLGRPASHARTT